MKTVKVKLKKKTDESYDILIGKGMGKGLAKRIINDGYGKSFCIITDSNVEKILGKKLLKEFKSRKVKADIVSFKSGEKNKRISTVEEILEKMLEKGFDRKTCIIALGGGITGDIAGFVASIFLRGINFVQVPTSLLAMVDSSIGGKTGVNLKGGKNSVGSFYQPKRVYMCLEFLDSLLEKEVREGMSEVVKQAIIRDRKFFGFIEKNVEKILKRNPKVIEKVVKRNCELKAEVVQRDEKEGSYRKILNYGHTIGHSLEVLGKYKDFSHGEAVSIGMVCEAKIAKSMNLLKKKEIEKIVLLLYRLGLPVRLPNYDLKKIVEVTKKDKKAVAGTVFYSLPTGIGKMYSKKGNYGIKVSDKKVIDALRLCV